MDSTLLPSVLTASFRDQPFGELATEQTVISTSTTNLTLAGRLNVIDEGVYALFCAEMATAFNVTMTLSGKVTVMVLDGWLKFPNMDFSQDVTLKAMNDLEVMEVKEFSVAMGPNNLPLATMIARVVNPSQFVIDPLGTVSMTVFLHDSQLMTALVPNVTMTRGEIFLDASGPLLPEYINNNNPAAVELFANYVSRQSTVVDVLDSTTTVIPYRPALAALSLQTSLPGSPTNLLLGALYEGSISEILWNLLTHFEIVAPFQLAMTNPLDTPVSVSRLEFDIIFKGEKIMSLVTSKTFDGSPLNVLIPPQSTMLSPTVPITASVGGFGAFYDLVVSFFDILASGIVFIDTTGFLDIHVGEIMLTLPYSLPDVPVCPQGVNNCDPYFPQSLQLDTQDA